MKLENASINTLQIIRKSNELIEARYRLSIWEQRLLVVLLANLTPQDEDFKRYSIRVTDFAKMWQLEHDNSLYDKVQEAADSLVGCTVQLSNDPAVSKTASWLAYVEYVKGSGVIEMEFHSSLKPYLLQLRKHFTQYQLGNVVSFRNQYTIRIYELLKMEAFKATSGSFSKHFKYTELRALLALGKKEYGMINDFKRRIINPSMKEISAHTDLNITDVRYGKTGRKITDITFVVKARLPEEVLPLQAEAEQGEALHPLVERLIELGFAVETAHKYKNRYGVKRIERNVAYAKAKQEAGLVKDFPAFLNQAIKDDMGGGWEVAQAKQAQEKTQKDVEAAKREELAAQAHLKKMQALANEATQSAAAKVTPDHAKNATMARKLRELLGT